MQYGKGEIPGNRNQKLYRKGKVKSMKKVLKTLGSLALAATLTMGMFTVANATQGSYTITINDAAGSQNSSVGNTYTLYKVADFNVSGGVYTNIKATEEFSSLQNQLEALNDKAEDSEEAVTFANTAAAIAKGLTGKILTVTSDNKSFDLTETGYYLIIDSAHGSDNVYLTTKYILVAVDGIGGNNKNIFVKTSKPDVVKKIVSEHDSTGATLEDADTVAIGDVVTYQIDATIPDYEDSATNLTYTLTDVMSSGLTFTEIKSVEISTNGSDWSNATWGYGTGSSTEGTAGATVIIDFTDDVEIATNKYVRVVLKATLNENANIGANGNPNSVDLTYSNNYYGGGTEITTPEDTVITYTGELNIVKEDYATRDAESKIKLSGAEFDIYRLATDADVAADIENIKINDVDIKVVKVITTDPTDDAGKTSVKGLDAGTYYAVESTAPEGYSIDATPIELKLTVENTNIDGWTDTTGEAGTGNKVENYAKDTAAEANSSVVINYPVNWKTEGDTAKVIYNKKGLTLPGTGGIGTTIFTFGGLALVILAVIMFIVYTRKQKKQA